MLCLHVYPALSHKFEAHVAYTIIQPLNHFGTGAELFGIGDTWSEDGMYGWYLVILGQYKAVWTGRIWVSGRKSLK